MNNKPSFLRQAVVLTKRYFHIFFNNRQNLALTIGIPLLTILIVCLVACPGMYSVIPEEDNEINESLPVLNWEYVGQYEEDDDTGDIELSERDEPEISKWNGEDSLVPPAVPTKVGDEDFLMITKAEDLVFLSQAIKNGQEQYLTYNYILQTDIDLKNHNWTPIGSSKHPFTGTFDGNGHIIYNMKIKSDDDNTGFFGCVKSDEKKKTTVNLNENKLTFYHNGIVENLQLQDVDISADCNNVGAIVGSVKGSALITGVSVKNGEINAKGNNVGGIVGKVYDEDVNIYICYSTASITSDGENVGGIVGDLDESCLSAAYYAQGEVEFDGDEDDAKHYGAVAGLCDDDEQFLNCFYEYDEEDKSFEGVDNEEIPNYVMAVSSEEMSRLASFLVPFEGIETAYDIENPSDEDDEDEDDDKSKEDEDEVQYGFKQDGQIAVFGDTQTGLFMLVCVAIFVGICNAIQEICKERNILKREYMTNLSLSAYVVSKLVVQACIVAVQMIIVMIIFALSVSNKFIPDKGVFMSFWTEYYITMFLLAFAADTMALVISSVVKNSATANTFIPIILIVQIVFSGVLFNMEGVMDIASNVMISKWGIAGLAASTGLNNSQPTFLIENPGLQLQFGSAMSTVKDLYASTTENLLTIWGILIVVSVVCAILCRIILTGVKKDKR